MKTFIDEHSDAYGIEPICKVLPIAPSTYYTHAARRSNRERQPARARRDATLCEHIRRVWEENFQVYGVRKVWRQLLREGVAVARCTVQRLMRRMGIEALYRKPNTSRRNGKETIYPYLLRTHKVERSNQVWAMDITYIPMAKGFVYLAAVIDWFSRRVLSWRVSISMETSFCIDAVEEALHRYGNPISSTPTRAASSPAKRSPACSRRTASRSAWTAKAAGATTSSSNACGNRSSTRRSICAPTTRSRTPSNPSEST